MPETQMVHEIQAKLNTIFDYINSLDIIEKTTLNNVASTQNIVICPSSFSRSAALNALGCHHGVLNS